MICALLEEGELKEYLEIAHSLGLSALVEAHTEEEIQMALRCGSGIIGVNNRNLKNFQVDISLSSRLRSKVPEDVLFVSESGIRNRAGYGPAKGGESGCRSNRRNPYAERGQEKRTGKIALIYGIGRGIAELE